VGVDEVDGADGFDAAFELAQNADGVFDGGGDGESKEFRGHAAGGGLFAMLEKFDDFLAGFGLHLDEDLLGVILGEIGEKIGGGVRIHLFDDIGGAFGVEGFDDGFLNVGFDLFEGLGSGLFVESTENGLALIGGEIFDDVGDIRGVKFGQTFVGRLQLDAASGIGLDEIDKAPGNGAEGNFLKQSLERGARRKSAQKAAYGATGTDIDGSNAESGVRVPAFGDGIDLQFNVIHADDFAAIDVDDLLVEEIPVEKK
jgi:hypothetical protein